MSIWIRELGPGEFDVLDAVFAGLSPGSRFNRFHGPTPRMPAVVRDALAAVDGDRHVAVAAYADDEPVGIARLIAVPGRPCDIAVEVIDRQQGRGIGTRLVLAVVERARTLGHTVVEAEILAENRAVRQLIDRVFPVATSTVDHAEITYRADLSSWGRDQSDAA
ncbi:MAG TPA: GNAT family N-acetyltransferase [Pseudonocardia sp.]